MAKWRDAVEKIRRLIDGNDLENEQVLEKLTRDVKRSKSESFLRRIVDEITVILEDEIIRTPSGKVYVPSKFDVFLSPLDDKELRADKRKFFENAIGELMHAKATELAGKAQLSVDAMHISLRVDQTLKDGEINVAAVADALRDSMRKSGGKTLDPLDKTTDLSSTIDEEAADFKPLYYLEVWRSEKKIEEFPIIKPEITIGRKCDDGSANIRLENEDRKISRLHANLRLMDDGEILVTSMHKNPTVVDGTPISKNESATMKPDGKIDIYDYAIKFRFG